MRQAIEVIYKVMFNHFADKDGLNSLTHFVAGLATSLILLIFLFNLLAILSLIINNPLNLIIPQKKGAKLLVIIAIFIANHFILFSILKFSHNGENGAKFVTDKNSVKVVWIGFVLNFIIVSILSFVRMYYFRK